LDRINNRATPIRSPYESAAAAPPEYRMPLFEDMTAYSSGRPGNSSNTYYKIAAALQEQGIDPATWNQLDPTAQWDAIGAILSPAPAPMPEAAPTPPPGPPPGQRDLAFRPPMAMMINPNRRGL